MKGRKNTLNDFMARIDRSRSDECWLWRGHVTTAGYGYIRIGGARISAHRKAYELAKGPIKPGNVIMHICDTPLCCNPRHLRQGTMYENIQDCVRKGRNSAPSGLANGACKYSPSLIEAIRMDSRRNCVIAKELGISDSYVSAIKRGLRRNNAALSASGQEAKP
jgi:hypothetical protein